jgi:ABC-type sugar transport system ATPase subunit
MTIETNGSAALEIVGASKYFGAVRALRDVSLSVGHGEVLALLGDNGAGKSTLIKAISGVHQLDQGEILIDGKPVQVRSSADARAQGIETVYQDLAIFDNLTPVANFFAGRARRPPPGPHVLPGRRPPAPAVARWTGHPAGADDVG